MKTLLVSFYWLFAFTALVFEPLYYYGCWWDGPGSSNIVIQKVWEIWMIYAKWDPLFLRPPAWLRVLCTIEVFIFGPLYGLTAIGIAKQSSWLKVIAYPFSGALIYSILVYFAMEFILSEPGTDFWMVILVNIPWTLVPCLLLYYVEKSEKKKVQ